MIVLVQGNGSKREFIFMVHGPPGENRKLEFVKVKAELVTGRQQNVRHT